MLYTKYIFGTLMSILFLLTICCFGSSKDSTSNKKLQLKFDYGKGYYLASDEGVPVSKKYDFIGDTDMPIHSVGIKNKFGAIDKNDKIIVPIEYEFVKVYAEIIVAFVDKWNLEVFDIQGKKLWNKRAYCVEKISNSLFFVGGNIFNQGAIYDKHGNLLHEVGSNYISDILKRQPNLIEFTNKENTPTYIDSLGVIIPKPKYLIYDKARPEYKGNTSFMFGRDEKRNEIIVNEKEEKIELAQLKDYHISDVRYNYAAVRKKDGKAKIFNLLENKFLNFTVRADLIQIKRCNTGTNDMVYFILIKNDGDNSVINELGETIIIYGEDYILDICDPNLQRYPIKRRDGGDANFAFYIGKEGENYFQHKKSGKIFKSDDFRMKYSHVDVSGQIYTIIQKDTLFGTMTEDLNLIIPLTYSKIELIGFTNRHFIYDKNKIGITDTHGNIILKPTFQEIKFFGGRHKKNGVLICKQNDRYTIRAFSGVKILEREFTSFKKYQYSVTSPEKYILESTDGNIILDAYFTSIEAEK